MLSKPDEIENDDFLFPCGTKTFLKTEIFENDGVTIINVINVISLIEFSSNTNDL